MVELQSNKKDFDAAQIQLVGISYDSVDVLNKFAAQRKITFPLLADPASKAIKAYGVLNDQANDRIAGVPHPNTFLVGRDGKIKSILTGTVRTRHTPKELLEAAKKTQ